MDEIWLLIGLSWLPSLILITCGLVCVFKKDWAWGFTEMVLGHLNPERTLRWDENTTAGGVFIIVCGFGLALLGLFKFLPLLQTP